MSKDSQANQPPAEQSWRPKGRCCPVSPSLPHLDTALGLSHTWAYQAQGLGARKWEAEFRPWRPTWPPVLETQPRVDTQIHT